MQGGRGLLMVGGFPIGRLTELLQFNVERPVVDRTGLTGFFDIKLELPPLQPVAATDAAVAESGPSIFAVLQEQLGLRVEEGKGPADVLVIDHVERPTEN